MIWNFDYTLPSLIFLLFFIIFYFLKPVLLTQSNRCFLSLIVFEALGFFITFISSYIDNTQNDYSLTFLYLLNNLYYIFYIARYFIISLFFAFLFNVKINKNIPTIITAIIVFSVVLLVIFTPIKELIYSLTPDGKYRPGTKFELIYFANTATLLLDTYYIIKYHKKLNTKEIISSIFTILILIACGIIDIFYQYYLTSDMFFLFVILTLFLAFENPDIYIDKKTGLYNVQAFSYVIQEYLIRKRKYSIMTFMIQNYQEKKQIYGSKRMDLALKEIGKFYLSLFHGKKYFYLQNGRFLLLDNSTKEFKNLKDKVFNRFEHPWTVKKSELHLNVLIIDTDKDIIFQRFEDIQIGFGMAITDAKKLATNYFTINKNSLNKIIRNRKVAKALDKSLQKDNLQVYLQPIINATSKKVVGAEALVRIYDEELGIIPPTEFISMAERTGSIDQLGEQVLNKVCKYLKESEIYKENISWINVNLSPVQCQSNSLQSKIDSITNSNTIDHQYIHLEITEEAIIDTSILKKQMNILITDGYNFALDDFGAGFSNIAKVKSLPFNNIKLDMSIVWNHFNAPDQMLPNIIKTFRSKGLTVTAEGVESKEMADSLEKMGCTYLQGYYFSKPVPIKEFESVIKSINS